VAATRPSLRADEPADPVPVALVTGASRRAGIGCAIARRLLVDGFRVVIHSWAAADLDYGAEQGSDEVAAVIGQLGGLGPSLAHIEADFADPAEATRVVEHSVATFAGIDVLIANHAISIAGTLNDLTAADLDLAWAVNARASVLLVKAFAEHHDDSRGPGRVVVFTSGQHLGPMSDELPYAISKRAIHQMTASLADALAD
jgi:3-oxoacyl-[acyl-carrier protein] reductase